MSRLQSSLRSIDYYALIRHLRGVVGLLLPEALHLKIIRWRLMRGGELIMEPFSSLGRTHLNGDMQWHGVSIGRRSYWVSGYCWGYGKVRVGHYCSISENVSIGAGSHPVGWLSTSSFFYGTEPVLLSQKKSHGHLVETTIGNDVWIGENAMVMQGIHVGDDAVVGGKVRTGVLRGSGSVPKIRQGGRGGCIQVKHMLGCLGICRLNPN